MFSKSSTNRLKGESRIPRPVQLNNTRPTQLNNTATENRIPLMKGKHDKPQRFKVADKRPLAKEFVKEPPKPISKQELQKPAVRKPEVFDNKALIDILNSTNSLDLDGKFTSARPKRASIYAGAVRVLKPTQSVKKRRESIVQANPQTPSSSRVTRPVTPFLTRSIARQLGSVLLESDMDGMKSKFLFTTPSRLFDQENSSDNPFQSKHEPEMEELKRLIAEEEQLRRDLDKAALISS